jgi:DNA-binding MarR family transcriptional regulator
MPAASKQRKTSPDKSQHRRQTVASLLRDTHRLYAKALQGLIAGTDISSNQWLLLRVLWEEDGLTQKELSQRLGFFESAIVPSIDNLEANGLVERVRNKEDRRKVNVCLTRSGRALEAKLLPFAKQVNTVAERGVPRERIEALCETLIQLRENLEEFLASRS